MPRLNITITTGSDTPIYRQMVDQVRLAVATGVLVAGDAMPSVRGLAEQLLINFNTVGKAYGELVRDGVLISRAGLGLFVAEKRRIYSRGERQRRLRQGAQEFVREAVILDFSPDEIVQAVETELTEISRVLKIAGGKR